MYPTLFKIFGLEIHTYGVFIATGFLTSLYIASYIGEIEGIKKEIINDFAFYILIFSIIGARILYVIIEYKYYLLHPFDIFKIWKGGLVYYGGFISAIVAVIFYSKKNKVPIFKIGDIFATVLPLGQAIGRIGCFFAGCCYGKVCHLPWAVKFSNNKSLAPLNVPLHPTELYHAFANFLIFIILFFYIRKKRNFYGEVVCFYGMLYSIGRFIIEFFRGDPRGFIWIFSTSQLISIFIFAISLLTYFILKNAKKII